MTPAPWRSLPARWQMRRGEVHVVRVDVPTARTRTAALEEILSAPERARAARFRHTTDRDRYVVARGVLRILLARGLAAQRTEIAPRDVVLDAGPLGKPFVAGPFPLAFNVSHSGDIVLLAFAAGREVGIDVEWVQPEANVADLAAVAFAPDERAWWAQVPPHDRHRAFFDLWTRKEALGKALGVGLGRAELPPLSPPDAAGEVRAGGRTWTVRRLAVAPQYPAALAAEGRGWRLHTWHYHPLGGPGPEPPTGR